MPFTPDCWVLLKPIRADSGIPKLGCCLYLTTTNCELHAVTWPLPCPLLTCEMGIENKYSAFYENCVSYCTSDSIISHVPTQRSISSCFGESWSSLHLPVSLITLLQQTSLKGVLRFEGHGHQNAEFYMTVPSCSSKIYTKPAHLFGGAPNGTLPLLPLLFFSERSSPTNLPLWILAHVWCFPSGTSSSVSGSPICRASFGTVRSSTELDCAS